MANTYPIAWEGYQTEAINTGNTIYSQGGVELVVNSSLAEAGEIGQALYTDDLASYGNASIVGASTTLTPSELSSYDVKRAKITLGKGLKESEFMRARKGGEDLTAVMSQAAAYSQAQNQIYIKSVLDGVFATSGVLNSTHYVSNTLSAITEGLMDAVIYDSLGEKGEMIDKIFVHSSAYKTLLPNMVPDDAERYGFGNAGAINTLGGKAVFINDTICATRDAGTSYPVFFAGGQPLFTEITSQLRVETQRDAATAGGQDEAYLYWDAAFGVKGISWTNTSVPTSTGDYETVGNYAQRYDDNEILLLRSDFQA